jgi:hypothetical protein
MFEKDDLLLGERIIGPTVKVGFLSFRSLHELLEKVAIRVEVYAASVRSVLGIKQAISVMVFLWRALAWKIRTLMPHEP